ncbi:transmembrane transport protein [Campylobacter sputorum subsp. bubulus]|uniref:Transmembrane transport protein n=1 Tax=Campylobacter sputorum subsp. sputorum TaxID=32024 RepID=A0A381DLM4_9BACT|nr:MFS transporter [Campylobacter sputorum]ASM34810.1 major facilitator superfamily transporter, possible sugar permease [Campylobacter sputorum aubsp. sputorum RM3237]KAB0581634.1 MFS transporter [Campylobacter sputorum subsp. sputorum]QEL05003.1 major facilitator superfamily transporter [Campylobacter sputorum subsp. sputorum]SUX10165.1 transmembrane transport protein [Campylobacter sputorum subsp. bubulus]SUX11490.1 transmembrane transport protein [Campylobacter sputorum subsp. sputorum]
MISPKRTIRILTALFVAIIFIFVGNSLALNSAGMMLKNINIDDFHIGIITSCFFLGAIFSSIFGYKFISIYGYIRSYAVFTALFAISAILHNIANNIILWAVLRFMLGFSYYSICMVVESWINARSRNEIRSRVFSFYTAIYYISSSFGMLLLSLGLGSSQVFVLSALFIMIGSIPLNIIRIKEPQLPPKKKIFIPNIFSLVPLALVTSFIGGILINGFFSMAGVFILSAGGDIRDASLFLLVAMAGGFFGHLFFGYFSDKFGRKFSIMLACVIPFISILAMFLFSKNILFYKFSVFFIGFGIFCLYALSVARANDVLGSKGEAAKISATLLLNYSIGSLLGPIIIGYFMQKFNENGFIFVYLVGLIVLFLVAYFVDVVPKERRSKFMSHHPSEILH